MKSKPMNHFAKIAGIAVLPIATLFILGQSASAETLRTQNFRVSIARNCEEGFVTCNNVTYTGTNLKTGQFIRLRGRTLHTLCADQVTPCRFLGYEFRNRNYRYVVTETGSLQVYQGSKLVLQENGQWSN